MRYTKIAFLPVDNANMTFIKLNDEKETTILYDMFIREKATDPNDKTYDVLQYLKDNLKLIQTVYILLMYLFYLIMMMIILEVLKTTFTQGI